MDFLRRGRGERFKPLPDQELEKLPDDVWHKCLGCRELLYDKDLEANVWVCPRCGYHHRITVHERIAMLSDEGSFVETNHALRSLDPLEFTIRDRSYKDRLLQAEKDAGVSEAVVTGVATLDGVPISLAVMVMEYLGGAVGSVAGEKITRAVERAHQDGRGLVIVSQSGGMRMHEGLFSLMQMAKTSGALARLQQAKLPFISIIADQTYGGATASWVALGDVIIAEPGARVGFSGPRVLQAIKVRLADDVQKAEFMLQHGMIDLIVPRPQLRGTVIQFLHHFKGHMRCAAQVVPSQANGSAGNQRRKDEK
ncbi:MAG: acetyl-CoA carboxylase carboxyl transferase subunit beta [Chloroflexi bacterium]|nr:acetyl-CoA carboxylase carboxyl transferase subunit beta [Chloroflexota bacterium]MCL5946973.1 acetyl-CoA carboxylase carboxyl transferase subunit beta [Chloroflexota bacterium]